MINIKVFATSQEESLNNSVNSKGMTYDLSDFEDYSSFINKCDADLENLLDNFNEDSATVFTPKSLTIDGVEYSTSYLESLINDTYVDCDLFHILNKDSHENLRKLLDSKEYENNNLLEVFNKANH